MSLGLSPYFQAEMARKEAVKTRIDSLGRAPYCPRRFIRKAKRTERFQANPGNERGGKEAIYNQLEKHLRADLA